MNKRKLALLAVALLFIFVPVVADDEIARETIGYTNEISESYTLDRDWGAWTTDPIEIGFKGGIEYFDNFKTLYLGGLHPDSVDNPALNTYGSTPFTVDSGELSGTLYYNVHFKNNQPYSIQIWLTFDKFEPIGSGPRVYKLIYDKDAVHNLRMYGVKAKNLPTTPYAAFVASEGGKGIPYSGTYIVSYEEKFENEYVLTEREHEYILEVNRHGYWSKIEMSDADDEYIKVLDTGVTDFRREFPKFYVNPPLTLKITDLNGNCYSRQLLASADRDFALSPLPPLLGQPVTATFTGSTNDVGLIIYTFGDAEYYSTDGASGDGELGRFKLINGSWMQADAGGDYTIPVDDPTSYQFTGPGHVGQYKFAGLVKDGAGAILNYQEIFTTVGTPHGYEYEFVVPTSARPGFGITAWLECSDAALDAADLVFYTLGDPEWYQTNHARGDGSWTGFKRINGAWYEYDKETSEFTIPATSPREYEFPPPTHPDVYKFMGTVKTTRGDFLHEQETEIVVSGPEIPPDASVTVYIKNSQTGALIANANIVIDALVNGEYYPVTNRTEPTGIFTINLQPTGGGQPNPDGYRLIVTADGYNNPMPEIKFTVDDYKNYIYCLLDPIAGGPVDENKTFIDFFVRDMASNPISGATVKFGKYTLITNSQGYTVFEVPKSNTYTWTISKSGYGPLTGNAVIGNDPRHTINTVLAPIVTPTPTTPIPTSPPIGPTPTMTAPTGEPVSNWLEWFAAHFGMILGGGVEIGKIFMWLCFTVPVGVYVGKEAKAGAAGFMAGAGIVTLFFVLIGWVPIWLVVLLALIIGLLYAKVFNSQDNGGGGR